MSRGVIKFTDGSLQLVAPGVYRFSTMHDLCWSNGRTSECNPWHARIFGSLIYENSTGYPRLVRLGYKEHACVEGGDVQHGIGRGEFCGRS